MVINVGIYHDFRDLCPFFIDSYLLCIESFIIFASENDLCQTYTFLRELVFQSYISQKFRMWFKYGLKAQKLHKQHALKVSYQNKAPLTLPQSLLPANPCQGVCRYAR